MKVLSIALVAMLLATSVSFAQSDKCLDENGKLYLKECSEEKPGNCSIPVCEGSKVPFVGFLVTESLIADLMLRAKNAEDKAKADIKYQDKKHEEKVRFLNEVHKLDVDLAKREKDMWKDLAEERKLSWYEKPATIAIVTAIAVSALAIGLSQGIRADLVGN